MHKKIVIFGEVLFDCFTDGTEILGGAPFNVAWHLQAFGLNPILITRVGEDSRGDKIIDAMNRWGMNCDYVQTDSKRPTGTVSITVKDGEPEYSISPEHAWGHIQPIEEKPADNALLYHGTLALWSADARDALHKLKGETQAQVFVDVNLRSPWWDHGTVLSLIRDASWVKLNEEEFSLLFSGPETEQKRVESALDMLKAGAFLLTRGERGATFYQAGKTAQSVSPSPVSGIVDTVGAGDAFSAAFIIGVHKGWPIKTTLTRAQDFASAIIMHPGATVQDREFYQKFRDRWSIT